MSSSMDVSAPSGAPQVAPVLPTGTPNATGAMDLATRVMALRAATRSEEEESSAERVQAESAERRAQMEARLQQILKATESREQAAEWGWLADVAKVVGVAAAAVVGVAGAAFSAGGSVVAAAAIIAALTAVQYGLPYAADEVARACGASEKERFWIGLGATVVALVISLLCPTGTGSTAVDAGAKIARAAGDVGAGAATCAKAERQWDVGRHEASAQRHLARATEAGNGAQDAMDELQVVLDRAQRASRNAIAIMMSASEGSQAALRA